MTAEESRLDFFNTTFIIPAYNEAETLKWSIPKLRDTFPGSEILIVENGTNQLDKIDGARVIHTDKKGLGIALREGMKAAREEKLIHIGADLPLNLDFVPEALRLLDYNEIVIGSKRLSGSRVYRPLKRKFLSWGYNVRYGRKLGVTDIGGAAKGFRRSKMSPIVELCSEDGIRFDSEVLKWARRMHYHVAEIPVQVYDYRRSRMFPEKMELGSITYKY